MDIKRIIYSVNIYWMWDVVIMLNISDKVVYGKDFIYGEVVV